jgi:hypothetical protein
MSRTRRAAALACLSLIAGPTGIALAAGTAGAATTPHAKGTVTQSVTGPAGKTHTSKHAITCREHNGRYTVTERTKRRVATLTVAKDHGAGSYTGRVSVWSYGKKGLHHRSLTVPVTLTSTGGSATYSQTLSGKRHPPLTGKKVSASANWTCAVSAS